MFGLGLVASPSCAAGFLQIHFGVILDVDVDAKRAAALLAADGWRWTGRFPQAHKLSSTGLVRPLGLWQTIPAVMHCLPAALLERGRGCVVLTLPAGVLSHSITAGHQAAFIHLFPCVTFAKSRLFPSGFLPSANTSVPS